MNLYELHIQVNHPIVNHLTACYAIHIMISITKFSQKEMLDRVEWEGGKRQAESCCVSRGWQKERLS